MELEQLPKLLEHYEKEFNAILSISHNIDSKFIFIQITFHAYHNRCIFSIGRITHNLAMKGIYLTNVKDNNNHFRYTYEKDLQRKLR